jgi:hypothetical protein
VQVRQKLRHHGIDQKYGSESFSLPLKPPYVIFKTLILEILKVVP